MDNIGIKWLITKKVSEIDHIVVSFIENSLNIRKYIIREEDPEKCMIGLIRDTYTCNLLLRYVGLMILISNDVMWEDIDNKLLKYIQIYYNNQKFIDKLITLFDHYMKTYEKEKKNEDYCKFLDKIICKGNISQDNSDIKKTIRMIENRIFNLLNINPTVKIATRHLNKIPAEFEIKQDKAIISLSQKNYHDLMNLVDDMNVRHQIEKQYMSKTNNVLQDFSNLILLRKELASQTGYSTFFKYINRGKFDNSETIKNLITELNQKINTKAHNEINKIHQYFTKTYSRSNNRASNGSKISICDVIKYNNMYKNNSMFNVNDVLNIILSIVGSYFNLRFEKSKDYDTLWRSNVDILNMIDAKTGKLLGRLFLDVLFDENKKVNSPISIRISDKMQINSSTSLPTTTSSSLSSQQHQSVAEVVLVANYMNNKSLTYNDVVLLFREFGYILSGMCYDSRVGLINYDEEFSNYLPLLMEYIAWDRDTIKKILKNNDNSMIDLIEMTRSIDLCFNLKLKCVNAKFDHLIHNSEPLLDLLVNTSKNNGNVSNDILDTYKDIYKEIMSPLADIMDIEIDCIDPLTIIQEINNSQSMLYANLMNEIFAYASYWIIKQNKNADFRNCVLNDGITNYRDLVRMFLKRMDTNTNCFSLYIKNVIKTEERVEEILTEDTNYFDDNQSDSEPDKEEIIQINRVR